MSNSVRLDVSGIDKLLQDEPRRVEQWLDGFVADMVTQMQQSFDTSPPGMTYQRGGVTHVASLPGYPPNVDIGTLTNSLHWVKTGRLEREIRDGVLYGILLEDGTEKMGSRPFVRPVFDDARHRIGPDARRNLNLER